MVHYILFILNCFALVAMPLWIASLEIQRAKKRKQELAAKKAASISRGLTMGSR
jgi:hypothetical protein